MSSLKSAYVSLDKIARGHSVIGFLKVELTEEDFENLDILIENLSYTGGFWPDGDKSSAITGEDVYPKMFSKPGFKSFLVKILGIFNYPHSDYLRLKISYDVATSEN